ncbi:polygalacturonase-like isoform X2 [Punica granatum]|uniref:endo-polygalacturonase n=1 Tax=Punica granatum TaxID=22663 RepID=A0A6P8DNX9_PUNGR|nr:polygalacturonase-like isoform X2 [Punica granatum]
MHSGVARLTVRDHEGPTPQHNYLDVDHHHHLAYPSSKSINDQYRDGLYDPASSSSSPTRTLRGSSPSSPKAERTVSVDDFGAKGDGRTDDTQAFKKAWKKVCSSKGAVLVVPQKHYLLRPIWFSGPCKDDLRVEIHGTVEASDDRLDYSKDNRHWLIFDSIRNLVVEGGGTIDGNGKIWWQNSCKINKTLPCKKAPTAVTFYKCRNLVMRNLKVQNAQQMHISFDGCYNVKASNLAVTAPGNSPNTDGIHVTSTQNIKISHSTIGTGDDCISIVSGSRRVQATDITCGPGHGISIGSLGKGNSEDYVSGVTVNRAKLSGTTNGVRIKTWQGGSGKARNIRFQNIVMQNVTNPIIIDQNYCDQDKPCKQQRSAVQVKNVVYRNIKGTSTSDVAVKFDCSKTVPCRGILLQNIGLDQVSGEAAKASCSNVKSANIGVVSPRCN